MLGASVAGGSQLSKSLVAEVNEYFLFHGTKQSWVKSIEDHGLDARLSANAMFGSGVYFAESSTKADQYAGDTQPLSLPFNSAIKVVVAIAAYKRLLTLLSILIFVSLANFFSRVTFRSSDYTGTVTPKVNFGNV